MIKGTNRDRSPAWAPLVSGSLSRAWSLQEACGKACLQATTCNSITLLMFMCIISNFLSFHKLNAVIISFYQRKERQREVKPCALVLTPKEEWRSSSTPLSSSPEASVGGQGLLQLNTSGTETEEKTRAVSSGKSWQSPTHRPLLPHFW